MKITVTESEFIDGFRLKGRESQFTDAALRALFVYLTEVEEETGSEIEFDVIAICCDYTEVQHSDEGEMHNYANCDIAVTLKDSTIFTG